MSELIKMTQVLPNGNRVQLGAFSEAESEISVWIETRDLDLGMPWKDKHLDGLLVDIEPKEALGGVSIAIGYKDRREQTEPIYWTGPYSLEGGDVIIRPDRYTARFLRFRIADGNPQGTWKLSNIRIYGTVEGSRL